LRQRGQALLGLLVLLGIAGSVFVYNLIDPAQASARREARTEVTLREVRDALVGWSAQRTPTVALPNARPGELPCPDINPLDGFEDGNCAAGALGRVPWKTLGIPEPKDESGETLWYAIAGPFRIWNTNPNPINSDTKGNLTVYENSPVTSLTTEAVATIFAAGAPLGTQNRDATVVVCPTTGTSIARNLCAANYLETAATVNNATTGGPFISAQSSGTFNDRLLIVTTADLMPVVEQRVAREVLASLEMYRNLIGAYPWADCSDGSSDVPPDYVNRGRIPFVTTLPANWSSVPTPPFLPAWFGANYWNWVIYYAAGKMYLQGGGTSCTTCQDPELTLTGAGTKRVVIIMTGPSSVSPPPGPPGSSNICSKADWQAYLEDSENVKDKDNPLPSDDTFKRPTSTAYVRDRLYTCPGTPGIC
jgi:hypothetical protein